MNVLRARWLLATSLIKVAACYLVDGARLALASLGVADYHTAGDASLGKDSLDSIVILLR